MLTRAGAWTKLGRILHASGQPEWMATYTGPSFAAPRADASAIDLYVTGRDSENRSRIGVVTLDRTFSPVAIGDAAVFDLGSRGAFDENGVSYPWIVESGDARHMYYVGWVPTVLTPFQNHLGLAIQPKNGEWRRYSRAPILERTDEEYLSSGSVAVMKEGGVWRMWYTSFREWGTSAEAPKHVYVIKYAESSDGARWQRSNQVCIDVSGPQEYSIGRPTVLVADGVYHMWFSHRGQEYRIGYAWSRDGIRWTRRDDLAGIDVSPEGWDSEAICYSHVFRWEGRFYMVYCGNRYGRDGLGLARWDDHAGDRGRS